MHAVVRSYAGNGASELFDLLDERKADVEARMREVKGFVSYSLIRTDDGGISVTVCEDKNGTDESVRVARDWVQAHASGLNAAPPVVSEGSVILHLS